jgi:uncharacterized protein
MKDPKEVVDAGLARILGAVSSGNPKDMHDALGRMLAEARAAMPDNAEFQAKMDGIAAQHAALMASQQDFEAAQASGDQDRINTALAALDASTPYSDPDSGYPPAVLALREAINESDILAVQACLARGIDLNRGYGRFAVPPINWAMRAEANRLALVTAVLDAGARADFATGEGYTPLHWIADAGYSDSPVQGEIARLLVARGADVGARNHYGWTPLHAAVLEGSNEELGALLAVGSDANLHYTSQSLPDFTRGLTPLMVAAGDPEKVALLLDHGADPMAPAADGRVPVAYVEGLIAEEDRPMGFVASAMLKVAGLVVGKNFKSDYRKSLAASLNLIRARTAS